MHRHLDFAEAPAVLFGRNDICQGGGLGAARLLHAAAGVPSRLSAAVPRTERRVFHRGPVLVRAHRPFRERVRRRRDAHPRGRHRPFRERARHWAAWPGCRSWGSFRASGYAPWRSGRPGTDRDRPARARTPGRDRARRVPQKAAPRERGHLLLPRVEADAQAGPSCARAGTAAVRRPPTGVAVAVPRMRMGAPPPRAEARPLRGRPGRRAPSIAFLTRTGRHRWSTPWRPRPGASTGGN